jgi:hypothetical protein
MIKQLLACLMVSGLISCSSDKQTSTGLIKPVPTGSASVPPNENVSALFPQFHGKYKVISSVSHEPVDVNLDGLSSTNLMTEIAELSLQQGTQYVVELRIQGPSPYDSSPGFLFVQWWPEQFIRTGPGKVWDGGEWLDYQPDYVVKYDFQGSPRRFSLSTDLKQITVTPDESDNAYRWVRPELVTVENSGRLRVVNKRRLYTRSGVKEVTITTVYERFTMTT